MTFDQAIDLTGQTFGELRVIERAGRTERGYAAWLCEGSCGARVVASGEKLRLGKKRTCDGRRGPFRHRRRVESPLSSMQALHRLTHGTWLHMRRRCYDTGSHKYRRTMGGSGSGVILLGRDYPLVVNLDRGMKPSETVGSARWTREQEYHPLTAPGKNLRLRLGAAAEAEQHDGRRSRSHVDEET